MCKEEKTQWGPENIKSVIYQMRPNFKQRGNTTTQRKPRNIVNCEGTDRKQVAPNEPRHEIVRGAHLLEINTLNLDTTVNLRDTRNAPFHTKIFPRLLLLDCWTNIQLNFCLFSSRLQTAVKHNTAQATRLC